MSSQEPELLGVTQIFPKGTVISVEDGWLETTLEGLPWPKTASEMGVA